MALDADVIAAIATPPGRGGIGVVRVSGPDRVAHHRGRRWPGACSRALATLARFLDARGEVLDQGLALWFPAPASYTGEAVLELHGHGGPAVLGLILRRCLELGARLAVPGEFTKRAFLNDKLDLAQAEGVADLIDAATGTAARAAARSLSGAFSREVARHRRARWSNCACSPRRPSIFPRRTSISSAPPMRRENFRAARTRRGAHRALAPGRAPARRPARRARRRAERRQIEPAQSARRRRRGDRDSARRHDARRDPQQRRDPRHSPARHRHGRAARRRSTKSRRSASRARGPRLRAPIWR